MLRVANNPFFPIHRSFFPVHRWAGDKVQTTLLASFLILALLLCHGAMGGFHQLAPHFGAVSQGQAHAHADHAGPVGGPDEERQAGHAEGHTAPYLSPPGVYLAALLVVFLATILRPALRGAASLLPFGSWAVRRPPPATFLRGRPPTASSLQVFRL